MGERQPAGGVRRLDQRGGIAPLVRRRRASRSSSAPVIAASRSSSNSRPSTAAAASTRWSSDGSRLSRRSRMSRMPFGTRPSSTPQSPVSSAWETSSSMKNGLPSVRRCTPATRSSSTDPARRRMSDEAAPSSSPVSADVGHEMVAAQVLQGAPRAGGRRRPRSRDGSTRPAAAAGGACAARARAGPSVDGSAQCRSSSTSRAGPFSSAARDEIGDRVEQQVPVDVEAGVGARRRPTLPGCRGTAEPAPGDRRRDRPADRARPSPRAD